MCTHNASGHGIGCQAIHTPYILYIQVKKKALNINAKIEDLGLNED